jgi:Asp-tRNA(Asn)/Glu-tRNA(Gln) amidotransferase A subunit family amidase
LNVLPGAVALATALEQRERRAEHLLRECFERIAGRETKLQALAHLDAAPPLARARQLDAYAVASPPHGLSLRVKDLLDTADLPTVYGSSIRHGHRPRADTAVVPACRAAGALIWGETVSTEFAPFTLGPTRKPHHLARERLQNPARLSERLRIMLEAGASIDGTTHRCLDAVRIGRRRADELFVPHDLLLAPSTAGQAGSIAEGIGDPLFGRSWSLLGLPCLHLPAGDDARVLQAGAWLHRVLREV